LSTSTKTHENDFPTARSAKLMRASVLCDVGRFEVRDVPRPPMSSHEVLVRVSAVGLCGTDSHIFAGHANYNTDENGRPISLTTQPQILGHEICGCIEAKGSEVHDLQVGERIVLDQGLNCRSLRRASLCEYCRTGDSHQCEFYREHGITGLSGGLAEFISVPAVNAVPIRSAIDDMEAALVEPLGCIIHSSDAVSRARSRFAINADSAERRVRAMLICGAGPAGLLFIQYLRGVLGYDGRLLVSEPNERKRKLAEAFCADEVIDPTSCDVVEVVKAYNGGKGVEYLIEASGAGHVLASIPGLIRSQATVLLYGHGHAGVDLSVLNNVMFREPTLVTPVGASGGFEHDGRPSVYTRALKLIEEHRIDVASLVTHRYTSLDGAQTALAKDIHMQDYIKGVVVL
jgi:threonine dehydrogenase-like Zn-dependent dehydrogenase